MPEEGTAENAVSCGTAGSALSVSHRVLQSRWESQSDGKLQTQTSYKHKITLFISHNISLQ